MFVPFNFKRWRIRILFKYQKDRDRAERHDLKSRLWLFFSPFLFPPKKRGKKKRRMNIKILSFCLIKDRS